jgi:hypothetical protein
MKKTVKARAHYGAGSLNLTIPSEIVREYKIEAGDVFEITVETVGNDVIIKYRRVYSHS